MISSCEDISCKAAAVLHCEICHTLLSNYLHCMINNIWCLAIDPTIWACTLITIFPYFNVPWIVLAKILAFLQSLVLFTLESAYYIPLPFPYFVRKKCPCVSFLCFLLYTTCLLDLGSGKEYT